MMTMITMTPIRTDFVVVSRNEKCLPCKVNTTPFGYIGDFGVLMTKSGKQRGKYLQYIQKIKNNNKK